MTAMPPPPQRIEEAFLTSWPSLQHALYDGWLLRYADGYTKRANSVNALYGSSLDVGKKISHCESAYRARGLPPIFRVTPFSQPAGLDEALASRGYARFDHSLVLYRAIGAQRPAGPSDDVWFAPHIDEWLPHYWRLNETPAPSQDTHRALLEASPSQLVPICHLAQGEIVSCALGIVEQGFVGLYDMVTAPEVRRHGHATRLIQGILYWAHMAGARHAYLQVVAANEAARALYAGLGYGECYDYWYRVPPRE